ncbi:hypothetical protein EG329_004770 [Mollisiaceae sp. DMI_Dod_QoI]|nr:hypothetical protein EG329_004770 [Helotiales sp. DMI_Dod_QoI]
MAANLNQVLVEVFHVVTRQLDERNLGGDQSTTILPSISVTAASQSSSSSISSSASPSSTMSGNNQQGGGSSGPTSSPLLFFVALGFGVVFTNLWIIVGVKYCFRYNARNRALRNGEEVDPINLENMPTRPHRRRREKKLMTMDEVNERFPLTKYKNWVASRAREGLPTSGGVAAAPPPQADGLAIIEGAPSSPTGTKHTTNSRPGTAGSEGEGAEITISPATNHLGGEFGVERKSMEAAVAEKGPTSPTVEEDNRLQEVQTTASTVGKHATATSEEEDDEDDHIHTAVPPELLTNPGDSCAICIDTLEEDDDIRGLTCGHAFHAGCLDPWLTSRRACCPLCKADYYTPKPRPEAEAVDADRTGRRRADRTNMPQAPQSAWTGIRGNPRLILPGRFGGAIGDATQSGADGRRGARRARRDAAPATPAAEATPVEGAGTDTATTSRRWVPRISNPFSNISMPAIRIPGRNRQAAAADPNTAVEPSPSQLEAGVVR